MIKNEIAKTFIALLRKEVGDVMYKQICLENVNAPEGICCSGDHCDSNVVMQAAFHSHGILTCVDFDSSDEVIIGADRCSALRTEANDLWNEAWDIAKAEMVTCGNNLKNKRHYTCFWHPQVYGGTPVELRTHDFFTEARGYTAEDIEAICKLKVGESYIISERFPNEHLVTCVWEAFE